MHTNRYSQTANLFRWMTRAQQQPLLNNAARSVGGAFKAIRERHMALCMQADGLWRGHGRSAGGFGARRCGVTPSGVLHADETCAWLDRDVLFLMVPAERIMALQTPF